MDSHRQTYSDIPKRRPFLTRGTKQCHCDHFSPHSHTPSLSLCFPSPMEFRVPLISVQENTHSCKHWKLQWFYSPMIQDNPGEQVLSQRRDLLELPLDFLEPDVLPAAQCIMSKHYRKTQWFGRLLFYRHGISTTTVSKHWKSLLNQKPIWSFDTL